MTPLITLEMNEPGLFIKLCNADNGSSALRVPLDGWKEVFFFFFTWAEHEAAQKRSFAASELTAPSKPTQASFKKGNYVTALR